MAPKGGVVINRNIIGDNRSKTVCLGGLFARTNEQFAPIEEVFGGYVSYIHSEAKRFKLAPIVNAATRELLDMGSGPKTLVGASMGGVEAPFVVAKYLGQPETSPSDLHVVLVDAPWGLKTLANPFANKTPLLSLILGWPMSLFDFPVQEGGLPKRNAITVPDSSEARLRATNGRAETEDEYIQYVISVAKQYLSGHRASQVVDWPAWMIKCKYDGSLEKASEALQSVKVSYIACRHPGNDVVKQPRAAETWKHFVPHLRVYDVYATHCGFLQNQPEFIEVFERVLA